LIMRRHFRGCSGCAHQNRRNWLCRALCVPAAVDGTAMLVNHGRSESTAHRGQPALQRSTLDARRCDLEEAASTETVSVVAMCVVLTPMTADETHLMAARARIPEVGADQRAPSKVPFHPIPTLSILSSLCTQAFNIYSASHLQHLALVNTARFRITIASV
jgi:hypothetical protein